MEGEIIAIVSDFRL